MHISENNLKNILMGSGVVSDAQFETAKEEAQRSNRMVENVLIGKGDITEAYFAEIVSNYFNVPVVNFNTTKVDDAALHLLPETFSKTKRIAVFSVDEKSRTAKVAMEDPGDLRAIALAEVKLQMKVEPHLAMPSSMKVVFKEYKKDIYKEFDAIIAESITAALESGGLKNAEKMAEFVPIVTITDGIIEYAVVSGASDIHVERLSEKVLVRYRVDGILRDIVELPKEVDEAIIARIKILSGLSIDVHFTPQDGRFKFKLEDQSIDVRVSVMPTFYGEKVVMRLLRGSIRPLNLSELGLSESDIAIVHQSTQKTFGMILVTGPTGSGKTTTLYAVLHTINTPDVNIATIEDPIEYDVARLNQTQVNPKAGITFANGLRSLMRQNPDIIMVGEIRDDETVGIALNAAMTGHLVLSTLHTNDAPTAIPRLIDMGGEPFLVANTLNLVIAQRLVRRICPSCVTSYAPGPDIAASIKKQLAFTVHAEETKIPTQLYKGRGCNVCSNTGYTGQVGIFEILNVGPTIKALIKPGMSIEELRTLARKEGMRTMFEDGLAKAEAGATTIAEVFRVIME
ncbi:hypothetical protein A3C91_00255 [Candidatus Azambacteria bacterium RIFCSPHIGHO2_02_FULL_52_12]|uniref:Bacterial type II secretion system protein E domain-containing protein n=1 Tax=Candidatus Azambacteria bacterium RIFCSPLOWO2_01_FULL_46_25 TaxID=1797298 RepID=A0A1F5BUL9_9BACT|nr:MAG: hypothetical protein A3C91_00255 [Candidatus Azambacteria bacterium RIFCSPHIGHO2_02_FULL_52_12]OGD34300.1 MAG: hypothetical protein A2988_02105 [Candidatus Azambacteria bacterium RIFCSPLOWO2_01_FULL_46_25]OGD37551.1 MAG: hypothetical protein A2850_00705 [Candidatus Azambacteria bacterium RIFCSPHIGHO2_01_FULL_51_74]